jgi:hypothetical protein
VDEPLMPGRGSSRTELALAGVVVVGILLAVAGFVFDLPWGLGGTELAIVAAPIVLAVLAITVVLRRADARNRSGRRR